MPQVIFASAVRRHVDCPDAEVAGASVGEVLGAYFQQFPSAQPYVLDERGAVRRHIAVFVDDDLVTDREHLTDPVAPDGEVRVFQALSGGAT